jgi:uncharacterized protein YecE (DUF72 family)
MSFDRAQIRQQAAALAARGVFIGTSSWKYPGWRGQLYDESRYLTRGKFSEARFERDCLAEYAEVFKTVCVDAAYYTFPRPDYLPKLAAQVPADFQFGLKVTDTVTLKRFPNLPRFGPKAGLSNPDFLNADLFASAFLKPCEAIRPQVGVLMFEFSKFYPADYEHGREFVADLGRFLEELPRGWPYAIELRNKHWLAPDYFQCLARHGVTHVFNNWSDMPPVNEQMTLPASRPNPRLVAARFLLKPGRKYEQAVNAFAPYTQVQEPDLEARAAGAELIAEGQAAGPGRKTLIYVNNRLEGNALGTLEAMVDGAED